MQTSSSDDTAQAPMSTMLLIYRFTFKSTFSECALTVSSMTFTFEF